MEELLKQWAAVSNLTTDKVYKCPFCNQFIPKNSKFALKISNPDGENIAHIGCIPTIQ